MTDDRLALKRPHPRVAVAQISDRAVDILVLVLFVVIFGVIAALGGSDAMWDLRNYHIYNPFAVLHGKLDYDIAPAQVQTYIAPQLDILYYLIRRGLNKSPILLDLLFSLPHSLSAFVVFRISLLFLPPSMSLRLPLALLSALVGATGAAALPTLAGSSSEMIPGLLCLTALLLLIGAAENPGRIRPLVIAGALLGAAVGLKLNAIPLCVGAASALLFIRTGSMRRWLVSTLAFGSAGVAGLVLVAAPWWLTLYRHYGSPLFPFYNTIFHSAFYLPIDYVDNRFKPVGLAHELFYPFFWAVDQGRLVSEVPMRDPRIAVGYLAVVATLVRHAWARRMPDAKTSIFLAFIVIAYALWQLQFSVFRYLAPLEFLSATAILVALQPLRTSPLPAWLPWPPMLALAVAAWALTIYPEWGRTHAGDRAVDVHLPPLGDHALVVMLDSAPAAYVAAFAPPSVRFVGVNNNLVSLGQDTLLERQAEDAIRNAGPNIWGLEYPDGNPPSSDAALHYYHLHRLPDCVQVQSNIDASSLRLCPLARDS